MTIDQLIAISGIAVPSIISIISLWISANTRSKLNASLVEVGTETSDTDTNQDPWKIWVDTPHGSTTTRYFGVKKMIKFKEPFVSTPSVSSSLSLVNTKSFNELLDQEILQLENLSEDEKHGLQLHVVTFVEYITKEGFELQVGLGAPINIGDTIVDFLKNRDLQKNEIDDSITFNNIKSRSNTNMTSDERWMLNFYYVIGTIDITWIAQAKASNS